MHNKGEVLSYISRFPEQWTGRQCLAYQNLYHEIIPDLKAQFQRKAPPVIEGGDFFASLSKSVEAVAEPDKEIHELDYATVWRPGGHWKSSMWEGLRYWFCIQCGRSFWYLHLSPGRDAAGVPNVRCYHCLPPTPGAAVACGRGEWTDDRFMLNHREPPQREQDVPPAAAGPEWERVPVESLEARRWAVLVATAPTPAAAWPRLPRLVRLTMENRGIPVAWGWDWKKGNKP